jgi:predicted transcriptional regulator
MPRKKRRYRLTDLQLDIMHVLWQESEASVAELQRSLGRRGELAYTTVATVLRRLEARGLVRHRVQDRQFIYRAAVTADEVCTSMTDEIIEQLFEGSLANLVDHFLTTRDVSSEELHRLELLIAERKKRP